MPPIKRERDTLAIWPYATFLKPHLPPAEDICEEPTVCVSINATWASYVMGALAILEQPDLWVGTEETKRETIQKVYRIMSMFSNPCSDSQSDYTKIINDWRAYQVLLETKYDGTDPKSIDEDSPDTDFDSDSGDSGMEDFYRDVALCHACRVLVDVFCAELLAQAGFYTDALNILAGLLATALGPFGAIYGLLVVIGTNVLAGLSLAALKSETARENVACCLYLNAKGLAISKANFCTIIDGCYESGSSHENDIMNAFRESDFCRTGNYVGFLKILAEQFRYAKAGLTDDCLCETWTIERLGGDGNANMQVLSADGGLGTYDAINDRYEGAASAGKIHLLVVMESPLMPFYITSINCEFTVDNTSSPSTSNYLAETDGAGAVVANLEELSNAADGAHTLGINDLNREFVGIGFRLEAQGTGGFVRLNKVSVSGRGFNPFA